MSGFEFGDIRIVILLLGWTGDYSFQAVFEKGDKFLGCVIVLC